MARGWAERGLVESAFLDWLEDEGRVSFPWSMIDKITPHPSERVQEELGRLGVADMAIARTNTGTLIAPFVNAEITEYLVLEDAFPNGRPALEGAGVYLTDRTTVEKAEKMKVGTCLNPLHTALAVYGCLLGYTSIAAEMGDADLKALVEHIAAESLPVVEDPGILSPRAFIDEVLHERFPHPGYTAAYRSRHLTEAARPLRRHPQALCTAVGAGIGRTGVRPPGVRRLVPLPAGGG